MHWRWLQGAQCLSIHSSNPRLRILELGNSSTHHSTLPLDLLRADSSLRHFRAYEMALMRGGKLVFSEIDGKMEPENQEVQRTKSMNNASFDALIVPPRKSNISILVFPVSRLAHGQL
jgi:hypothetical protein